jgi:bifunctional UDP-N-acetylglucosamine pyrophosphorylase / glucosamine-1-phosphate N-acetyltransferase
MDKIQVIILAAGKGKRMNAEVPKALVPFHGKSMIDYSLDAVAHSGIREKPVLVVGFQRELVMNHVGEVAKYAIQEEQLGTGHAVTSAQNAIPESAEHVLVLFADQPAVTGAMIANLVNTHLITNPALTMATVNVPSFEDWYQVFYPGFSRIIRGGDGKIVRSVEFKDATEDERKITEVNPVYFCFNKKWLFEKLPLLRNQNAQGEYYLTDLVKYAADENSISSVSISPEEALGVNSIEELKRLEQIINNSPK